MVNHELTQRIAYALKSGRMTIADITTGELSIIIETATRTVRHANQERNKTFLPQWEEEYALRMKQKRNKE